MTRFVWTLKDNGAVEIEFLNRGKLRIHRFEGDDTIERSFSVLELFVISVKNAFEGKEKLNESKRLKRSTR